MVFDKPGAVTYQRMNGDPVDSTAEIGADTITISAQGGAAPAELTMSRPTEQQLHLAGTLQRRPVAMTSTRST